MKRIVLAALAAMFIIALGCVNIPKKFEAHITLDIRQTLQQEAASTLDLIEGQGGSAPAPDAAPKADSPNDAGHTSWLYRARDALSPVGIAYAAETDGVSESKSEIVKRMAERNPKIDSLKKKGYLGENNRGYLELRPSDGLTDPDERNEVQRLFAEENKDRKALYQEDARLKKDQKVSVSTVERIYAVERIKRAKPGEIVQLPAAGEDFDAVKQSPLGRRLGDACVPEAWIAIE